MVCFCYQNMLERRSKTFNYILRINCRGIRWYVCGQRKPQKPTPMVMSKAVWVERTQFNLLRILSELIGFFNKFFQYLLQNTLMDGLKDPVQWMKFSKFYLGSELNGMPRSYMGNFRITNAWAWSEKWLTIDVGQSLNSYKILNPSFYNPLFGTWCLYLGLYLYELIFDVFCGCVQEPKIPIF